MRVRRRSLPRHAVGFRARLVRIGGGAAETDIPVEVQDASLGGTRFLAGRAVPPGSIWRMQFETTEMGKQDVSLLIRSCRACGGDTYEVGSVCILDVSILAAMGIDVGAISTVAHELVREGARPAWELRRGLVAAEPLTVASISTIAVHARNDLMVSEGILDCTLDVAGRLIAPEASLVGGSSHVLRSVSIGELGSPDGTPTVLVLGESMETNAILDATRNALAARGDAIRAKQATIADLSARPASTLTHADRETLTVLMSELPDLVESHARMETNARKISERSASAREVRLSVARAIHAGARVVAGSTEVNFTRRLAGPLVLGHDQSGAFGIISTPDHSSTPIGDCATVIPLAA